MIERRCDPACLLSAVCAEHAALERPLADRARCLANRSNSIPDQSLTVRPVCRSVVPHRRRLSTGQALRSPSARRQASGAASGEDRDVPDRRRRPRRVPRLRCPAAWAHQQATFCAPQFELSASGIGPDSSYRGRCEKQEIGYASGMSLEARHTRSAPMRQLAMTPAIAALHARPSRRSHESVCARTE